MKYRIMKTETCWEIIYLVKFRTKTEILCPVNLKTKTFIHYLANGSEFSQFSSILIHDGATQGTFRDYYTGSKGISRSIYQKIVEITMVALCGSNIPNFYCFDNHFCEMGKFVWWSNFDQPFSPFEGYHWCPIFSIIHGGADNVKNKLNPKKFNTLI